jgi:hypothetical protein
MTTTQPPVLEEYRRRRNFRRTTEPRGGRGRRGARPIFVVQKHDASRLHYDLRLEVDGVLVLTAGTEPLARHDALVELGLLIALLVAASGALFLLRSRIG